MTGRVVDWSSLLGRQLRGTEFWEALRMSGRILILTHTFPPTGGTGSERPFKFASYLPQFGWQVTVLTAKVDSLRAAEPDRLDDLPSDVEVRRVWDPLVRLVNSLSKFQFTFATESSDIGVGSLSLDLVWRRSMWHQIRGPVLSFLKLLLKFLRRHVFVPDQAIGFALFSTMVAIRLVRELQINCIYTTSGPNSAHMVGWLVHRLTGIPWVADFPYPWTDNTRFRYQGIRKRLETFLESRVFLHASRIVTSTNGFKTMFERKYPCWAGRITVIRNGVDPSDFPSVWRISKPGPFVLFYAGMLTPSRNPKVIFQALSTALRYHKINEREVRVVFAGVFDYPGSTENRRLVHDLGLDNVVLELGYLPRKRVLEELQTADAILLIGNQEERAKEYIPSRLYEYLYARRPILAVLREGEAARLIYQLEAGVVFKANDIQGITNQLVSWVRQKRKGNWPLSGHLTDSHRFAPFTRLGQASELAGLLDSMFPEEKNGRMTGNL